MNMELLTLPPAGAPRLLELTAGAPSSFRRNLARVCKATSDKEEHVHGRITRTHMAIQALLRAALDSSSRRDLLAECWRLLLEREPYTSSQEELTPIRWDWLAGVPLVLVALRLLVNPGVAKTLSTNTVRSHELDLRTVRTIREGVEPHLAVHRHGRR